MAGHRFMHGQIADKVIVVLAKERFLFFLRPIFWGGRNGKKCFWGFLERPGGIAIRDGYSALEFRHYDHFEWNCRDRHQVALLAEIARFAYDFLRVANYGAVVLMLLGQPVQNSGGDAVLVR